MLRVGFFRGKKKVRELEIPDPSDVFCERWNQLGTDEVARPCCRGNSRRAAVVMALVFVATVSFWHYQHRTHVNSAFWGNHAKHLEHLSQSP